MKLWIARFVLDLSVRYHQYELLIAAPDSSEVRRLINSWEKNNCVYDECIDYRTLTIQEIDISKTRVIETFDRGVI